MLKLLFLVLSCSALVHSQECNYESGIEYVNTELVSKEQILLDTTDLCCYACEEENLCQVWTYVEATKECILKKSIGSDRRKVSGRLTGIKQKSTLTHKMFDLPNGKQFVQGAVPPVTNPAPVVTNPAPGAPGAAATPPPTSTITPVGNCITETDANYPGNDVGGMAGVAQQFDCCNLCAARTDCQSWAYLTSAQYCFFKSVTISSQQANRQAYPGMISGGPSATFG